MANLKGRSLISMADLTQDEVEKVLSLALDLKQQRRRGLAHPWLQGRVVAMIFEKPSTRTRISFEAGVMQLGGQAILLSSRDMQIGRGETVADTARVLSRFVDAVMARTFAHETLTELARWGSIPVINGLSDLEHPCQALGDLLTLQERFGRLEGLKLAYLGDGNNVANSLLLAAAIAGLDCAVAHPPGYAPDEAIAARAAEIAAARGRSACVTQDPQEALHQADAVYTDVWTSMGQEGEEEARRSVFAPYQVNEQAMARARPDAVFMHCLPAHRGEEVSAAVMDGAQSIVFDQTENRLHVQKAVMALVVP
ncbi:MAG: ornithine carbamoyltransferase [Proteobacteria bacterium]|nr:ornithine carbamoyltransferase [Pseudomonadota bacterium]